MTRVGLGNLALKILHVVGARPNFIKVAPVCRALSENSVVEQAILHTGQHYDVNMSDVFFEQLGIGTPRFNLGVGSGSHAQQTAEIIKRFEPIVIAERPDWVLVYGDVNSTVAAALVCSKIGIKLAHVEAGLRSFDRTMPEEINRVLTDHLADLLFTPSEDGNRNLAREGIAPERVHLVGNVMIDTLIRMLPHAASAVPADIPESFILVTLHRPSNVDDVDWLADMLRTLLTLSQKLPIVFPIHPRTRERMRAAGLGVAEGRIRFMDPIPYLSFLGLQQRAKLVITDSGGIQEETTFLQVPCLTVRENTERPITVSMGTNQLVGRDVGKVATAVTKLLSGTLKRRRIPPLWDGHAAERIAAVLTREDVSKRVVSIPQCQTSLR
ncbi:MAG TPA: UDP-N-acetylglucosamine 2-epimerase (non-hydrolyzing) [Terriglobales bacterium]|jgi:UDP-N-acetylglucosamine 2-epimerase (non-hydrolysing)|nr:UDP-N-acetylglucosamine 2-epimerase (non-hydrolyzing) [Terriglobales bacterium]